jgi:hypothetical protein
MKPFLGTAIVGACVFLADTVRGTVWADALVVLASIIVGLILSELIDLTEVNEPVEMMMRDERARSVIELP